VASTEITNQTRHDIYKKVKEESFSSSIAEYETIPSCRSLGD